MSLSPLLDVLRCVGCRSNRLLHRDTALDCADCGRSFPIQAGVPVMIEDAIPERGALLDPEAAAAVMQRFGIPPGPVNLLRVRRASGAQIRHGARDASAPAGTEAEMRCEWLSEYLPRAMRPGEEMLANVRFRNAGPAMMGSAGDGRVTLACQWSEQDGGDVGREIRTPLATELAPGQSLTMPVRLNTPPTPGRYLLSLSLVQEGVRWLTPSFGPFRIHVHDGAGFKPPAVWVLDGAPPQDEVADRSRGLGLMRDWVGRLSVAHPRLLQLGGGAMPVVSQAGYDAITVDDDLLALQLGELVAEDGGGRSVCAHLAELPLAEAAFDAALCFGSLHLFPDPAAVLRNLRPHLRPGGFIGLFCQPVGHAWPGVAAAAQLCGSRSGAIPQRFNLEEYDCIFHRARLRVAELVLDGASLKARLEPE